MTTYDPDYARAIQICSETRTMKEWRQVVIDIARVHPAIVVEFADETDPEWTEVKTLARQGNRVEAIKKLRGMIPGMSIADAKIEVEKWYIPSK